MRIVDQRDADILLQGTTWPDWAAEHGGCVMTSGSVIAGLAHGETEPYLSPS